MCCWMLWVGPSTPSLCASPCMDGDLPGPQLLAWPVGSTSRRLKGIKRKRLKYLASGSGYLLPPKAQPLSDLFGPRRCCKLCPKSFRPTLVMLASSCSLCYTPILNQETEGPRIFRPQALSKQAVIVSEVLCCRQMWPAGGTALGRSRGARTSVSLNTPGGAEVLLL